MFNFPGLNSVPLRPLFSSRVTQGAVSVGCTARRAEVGLSVTPQQPHKRQ